MSQHNPRSPGFKRPRHANDWTCPKCGNMNFSFREVCNKSGCEERRIISPDYDFPYNEMPHPHLSQPSGPNFNHAGMPFPRPPSPGFGYSGMPPVSMYPMSHTEGGAYSLRSDMPMANPQFFPSRSHYPYGNLGAYEIGRPSMEAMNEQAMYVEQFENRKRRADFGAAEQDWFCSCGNRNFSYRTVCNLKRCRLPRPPSMAPHPPDNQFSPMERFQRPTTVTPRNSWICHSCSNVNYPFRTHCNRKNCGEPRGDSGRVLQPDDKKQGHREDSGGEQQPTGETEPEDEKQEADYVEAVEESVKNAGENKNVAVSDAAEAVVEIEAAKAGEASSAAVVPEAGDNLDAVGEVDDEPVVGLGEADAAAGAVYEAADDHATAVKVPATISPDKTVNYDDAQDAFLDPAEKADD